jgi:hypothetical protein
MSSSVLSAALTHSVFGGFVNRFRNGTMDVWQRGTAMTVSTTGAYTADGWIVIPAGASVTAQQAAGRLLTSKALQITGATGCTGVLFQQRIESFVAAPLSGQVVTVQWQVFNNTGGVISPALTVQHCNAPDNLVSLTSDVVGAVLQSCPNGQWTRVAYSFVASTGTVNGLIATLDFGNNFSANTKTISVAEADIRVTPGLTAGLNGNPPAPELRPIFTELAFCQRYLPAWLGLNGCFAVGQAVSTGAVGAALPYPVTPRIAPNGMITSAAADFKGLAGGGTLNAFSSVILNGANLSALQINCTGASGFTAGNAVSIYGSSASDFILATGCEL